MAERHRTPPAAAPARRSRRAWILPLAVLILAGLLRAAGLFRGLDAGVQFHPDVPKQVSALDHILRWHYVWYTGNRALDGYPVWLNHVDAWCIRGIRLAQAGLHHWLGRPGDVPLKPPYGELTWWVLALRAVYGTAVVWMTALAARALGLGRRGAWLAAGAVALAPLALAVAHFATGDIACDLFLAAMALCLAAHAHTGRRRWLAAAGAMVGFAFAGKYNGALGVLAVGPYVLAQAWVAPRRWRRLPADGLAAAGACVAAVLVAMPHLVFATRRSLYHLGRILEFIRVYGVPAEFQALPAHRRVAVSLGDNLPRVLGALGWGWSLLGLAAAGWASWRAVRAWRTRPAGRADATEPLRLPLLWAVLLVFPWASLLVSLLGKPRVHAFQFSYLQPFLCLGGAWFLCRLAARPAAVPGRPRRGGWRPWLAVLLGAVALGETVWTAGVETWFWRRADIEQVTEHYVRHGLGGRLRAMKHRYVQDPDKVVRELVLEPEGPSHFRNRPRRLLAAGAPLWQAAGAVPVPTVPYPPVPDWVFQNGPLLPRNDRTRPLRPWRADRFALVRYARPRAGIEVGVRSGYAPVRVRLRVGGRRLQVDLPPHSQQLLRVPRVTWRRRVDRRDTGRAIYLVDVSARAELGEAWVTFPADERESALFRCFGGDAQGAAAAVLPPPDTLEALAGAVDAEPYLEGTGGPAPAAGGAPALLMPAETPLAAGAYVLTLDVESGPGGAELEVRQVDARGCGDRLDTVRQLSVAAGGGEVAYRWEKPFAPYTVNLELRAVSGSCRVRGWRLRPDTRPLVAGLRAMQAGGDPPAWLRRGPDGMVAGEEDLDVRLGPCVRLLEGRLLEETIGAGQPLRLVCRVAPGRYGPKVAEHDLFVHLVGADGLVRHAAHVNIFDVAWGAGAALPLTVPLPADLPAGTYRVLVGAWHRRGQVNRPVRPGPRTPSALRLEPERVDIGAVTVAR